VQAIVKSLIKSLESNQRMNLRVPVFGQWPNFKLKRLLVFAAVWTSVIRFQNPERWRGMLDSTCLPNREREWPHPVAIAPGSGSSLQSFGLIDPSHRLSPIVQIP
jgi:hypothetical protein